MPGTSLERMHTGSYAAPVQTVVLDTRMPGVSALMAERARLGVDHSDEVWDGFLHMPPGPSSPHSLTHAEIISILVPLAKRVGLMLSYSSMSVISSETSGCRMSGSFLETRSARPRWTAPSWWSRSSHPVTRAG